MSSQTNEASKISAIKDQAVGTVKEAFGNVFGNNKLELEGRAQKIHGQIEYQYAKALKEGETEPQNFQEAYHPQDYISQPQEFDQQHSAPMAGQAPPPPTPAEFVQPPAAPLNNFAQPSTGAVPVPPPNPNPQQQSTDPSQMSAWKDQAVGAMKENWGEATNNPQMQMEGKAQNFQGKMEGRTEPPVQQAPQSSVEGDKVSSMSAMKDKAMGSLKENWGSATGNTNTELKGKAQNMHGRNEAAFAKAQKEGLSEPEHFAHGKKLEAEGEVVSDEPSKMSGWKDQTMGAMKETLGSVTNNPNMELKGKAQNVHGRNEAAFAQAHKEGLAEPEHFGQGLKTTERAEGSVEGDKVSSMSAMKDKAMGTLKENWGSATGNMNTELEGKAQQMHGRNEAEFAKAQKQGLNEPEHYAHGTKTTDHAQGEVVSQEPSKMSGYKDQAVGAVKESFGKMTSNQNMELEGKAQKMQGSHATSQADAKNTMNA